MGLIPGDVSSFDFKEDVDQVDKLGRVLVSQCRKIG